MSTSLLYHGFGIVGYRYVSQNFEAGMTTFRIEQKRERLRCSHCGSDHVWAQGGVERSFHTIPIGSKPTYVSLLGLQASQAYAAREVPVCHVSLLFCVDV